MIDYPDLFKKYTCLVILSQIIKVWAIWITNETCLDEQRKKCSEKLEGLLTQRENLSKAIDQLLENISKGEVIISSYKQMKMYNDDSLNPELYSKDD